MAQSNSRREALHGVQSFPASFLPHKFSAFLRLNSFSRKSEWTLESYLKYYGNHSLSSMKSLLENNLSRILSHFCSFKHCVCSALFGITAKGNIHG